MKRLQVWLPLLFSIVMIIGMMIGFSIRENTIAGKSFFHVTRKNALQEVLELIRSRYVDKVNTDTLNDEAIQVMLSHLDPHSVYIPASRLEEVNEDLAGNFEGIGVEFRIIKDTVNVMNVLPDGPSGRAGLQTGDKFIKVNDSVVAGNHITDERIKSLLKGKGGSLVIVSILRDKNPRVFTIKRGTIPKPSLDASYMLTPTTGYIRLNKFAETTYEEFMLALQNLQKKKMQHLVLDLRDNGGGILQEAVQIADEFLDDNKLIVYTQGDKLTKEVYDARKDGLFEKGKLVVLIDELSASASEVLAGALQDWDRAIIIGRRSFGKGLVQEQYQLSDGSALRLTVARYYTPSGRSIQKPYNKGNTEYNEEVFERFHNGEVLVDTMKNPPGPVFKTKGGRKVYGGGGITPDIFVPFDTSNFQHSLNELYYDNAAIIFPYYYFMNHRKELSQYKDPFDFASRFNNTEGLWKEFVQAVKSDTLKVENVKADEKRVFLERLKANIARQIWRTEGYFKVINTSDPIVQRAIIEAEK